MSMKKRRQTGKASRVKNESILTETAAADPGTLKEGIDHPG
jgi:hypothetical protein